MRIAADRQTLEAARELHEAGTRFALALAELKRTCDATAEQMKRPWSFQLEELEQRKP